LSPTRAGVPGQIQESPSSAKKERGPVASIAPPSPPALDAARAPVEQLEGRRPRIEPALDADGAAHHARFGAHEAFARRHERVAEQPEHAIAGQSRGVRAVRTQHPPVAMEQRVRLGPRARLEPHRRGAGATEDDRPDRRDERRPRVHA
jgi:hypothetical protein